MAGDPQGYLAPAREARAEIRDRGSRFLAVVGPATDERTVQASLEALREELPDATHHCWAARLGAPPLERSSDAGEPAGTAGIPILQVLRGAALSDVVAVVVRWFGGTKLGKGGLARAYAGATREAVEILPRVRKVPAVELAVELPYELIGAVKRLINPPGVELTGEDYGASVRLRLTIHEAERDAFEAALADLRLAAEEV
ncbi:MAG: YigZ family protein [Acidobacteriota bacterium]|jgi:uncharacterized YigZ family protein